MMQFQGDSGGHPRFKAPARLRANGLIPGAITTIPVSLKLRKEYIGYIVHWKWDYSIIPRSLVAPSREAGGLLKTLSAKFLELFEVP